MTWINADVNTLSSPDRVSFKIGDIELDIPPQAITISRQENHGEMGYLRAPGTVKIPTGQSVIRIDVDFVIATDSWNADGVGGEGTPLTNLELLSRLVAMTRVTPFVPVQNAYIERHIPIGEPATKLSGEEMESTTPIPCAITAFNVTATGDAPALLNCHLSLLYWNPEPFAGEEKIVWTLRSDTAIPENYWPYIDKVVLPSFQYVQSQNPNSVIFRWHKIASYGELSRMLGLIENANVGRASEAGTSGPAIQKQGINNLPQSDQISNDNAQIIDGCGWARVDPANRNATDPLYYHKNPEQIDVTPVPAVASPVNQVAVGVSIAFQNRFALLPLQGSPYPTIQHLGAADTEVQLSLVVKSVDERFRVAGDIEQMLHVMAKRALRYRGKVFSGKDMRAISYVGVINPLLAACGLREFVVGATTLERDQESAELVRLDVSLSEIPWAGESEPESMVVYNTSANIQWSNHLVKLLKSGELTKRDVKDQELARRIANLTRFVKGCDEALKKNHEIYPHFETGESVPADKLPALRDVVVTEPGAYYEAKAKKGKEPEKVCSKQFVRDASLPVHYVDFPRFGITDFDILTWIDKHDVFPTQVINVSLLPSDYFDGETETVANWLDTLLGPYPDSLGGHFERNAQYRLTNDGFFFDYVTNDIAYGRDVLSRWRNHTKALYGYKTLPAERKAAYNADASQGEAYAVRRSAEEFIESYMLALHDLGVNTQAGRIAAVIMNTPAAKAELGDIANQFIVGNVPGAPCYRDLFLMSLESNPYDWLDNSYSVKMADSIQKTMTESANWVDEVVRRSRNAIAENQGTYYTPKTMDYDPSLYVDDGEGTEQGKSNYTGEFSESKHFLDSHGVADPSKYVNPVPGATTLSYNGHFGDQRQNDDGTWRIHKGVDIPVANVPVVAAAAGKVVKGVQEGGYGLYLDVTASDGSSVIYGHLAESFVSSGDSVDAGQLIAKSGNTGNADGFCLHFEIRDRKGDPVDPSPIITGKPSTLSVGETDGSGKKREDKTRPVTTGAGQPAAADTTGDAADEPENNVASEFQATEPELENLARLSNSGSPDAANVAAWRKALDDIWNKSLPKLSSYRRSQLERVRDKDAGEFYSTLDTMLIGNYNAPAEEPTTAELAEMKKKAAAGNKAVGSQAGPETQNAEGSKVTNAVPNKTPDDKAASSEQTALVQSHVGGVIAYNHEAPQNIKAALAGVKDSLTTDQFTVRRCFPAFKLYFVEDNDQGVVHALDEFYAWNAVLDWKLSEAAHRPATLMITVSNMFNHLDSIVFDATSPRSPGVQARTGGFDPVVNYVKTPAGSYEVRPRASVVGTSPAELNSFDYQVDDGGDHYLEWIDADTGEYKREKQIDVEIEDGDSLNIVRGGKKVDQIRLFGIDAEEVDHSRFNSKGFTAQPYGEAARSRFQELVKGKEVHVEVHFREPFGRAFGEIFVDGQSVNLQLVKEGLAHATPPSCGREYMEAERQAREAGLGLWAQGDPVHPGSWRFSTYQSRMRPIETKGGGSPTGVYTQDPDPDPVQNINHIMLKPGTKIVLKAGYNNDPDKLETIFAGEVTEIDSGEVMTIVCQDWGFELTHVFDKSPEIAKVLVDDVWFSWFNSSGADMGGLMSAVCAFRGFLSQPCCRHLGRWEINKRDEGDIGAFDWKLNELFKGMAVNGQAGSRALVNINPVMIPYYSPLTDACLKAQYINNDVVDKGTMWDLAEEMRHIHLNTIFAVRPYGAGNGTVYFGPPWGTYKEDSIFSRLTAPEQQVLSNITSDIFWRVSRSSFVVLNKDFVTLKGKSGTYAPTLFKKDVVARNADTVRNKIRDARNGESMGQSGSGITVKIWQVLANPYVIAYMLARICQYDPSFLETVRPLLDQLGWGKSLPSTARLTAAFDLVSPGAFAGNVIGFFASKLYDGTVGDARVAATRKNAQYLYEIYKRYTSLASAQAREASTKFGSKVQDDVESIILAAISRVRTDMDAALRAEANKLAAQADPQSLDYAHYIAVARALKETVHPIRKMHVVTSRHHIVSNGMTVSGDFANAVSVDGDLKSTCSYDGHLIDRRYRNFATILGSSSKEKDKIRGFMAASMLADQFKTMYRGEIILTGDPTIRPHDLLSLVDENRQIFGVVEVDRVVHSMDFENGFITVVTPALLTEVSDMTWIQAYQAFYCALAKQMDQMRQMGEKSATLGKVATKIADVTEKVASYGGESPAKVEIVEPLGGYKLGVLKSGDEGYGPLNRQRAVARGLSTIDYTTWTGAVHSTTSIFAPFTNVALLGINAYFIGVLNTSFCGYARSHCINFAPVVKRGVGWFAGIDGANGGTCLGQSILDIIVSVQEVQKYADLYHVYVTEFKRFQTTLGAVKAVVAASEK
ncbi:MAG: peptidoglycan DD-metalloendopeptidase family protein [Candidatus Polarisedimenticolia bacterium]